MRQFAWFDCVRCAAIFLVMYAHGGDFYKALPAPIEPPLAALNAVSWTGVELFFVLSGFLVSGLLFYEHEKTGVLNIKRFLVRRAFKIIPAFYFLLIVTIVHDSITAGHEFKSFHFLHDFLFMQNYRMGRWGHGWTLALEVHFYILLALLLYFLARHSKRNAGWLKPLPWILAGVIVFEFFARWLNAYVRGDHHFDVHRELQPSHLHLDVLAAGVLLRYVYNYHFESLAIFRRARIFWFLLGLLFIWPSAYLFTPHSALMTALIPTCDAIGFGLILFQATQLSFPASGPAHWLVKPFDYLGKHSYSIYLWHLPVREWLVVPFFAERSLGFFFVFFAASLAVGAFFSEVLEMPILHLRDWLFPSKAKTPATTDPAASPAVV